MHYSDSNDSSDTSTDPFRQVHIWVWE